MSKPENAKVSTPATGHWVALKSPPSSSRWQFRGLGTNGGQLWVSNSNRMFLLTKDGRWFRLSHK